MSTTEPLDTQLWRSAYHISWVGACNPRAVQHTLDEFSAAGVTDDHPAIRCIKGHLAFLQGTSLGPEMSDLSLLQDEMNRLGLKAN